MNTPSAYATRLKPDPAVEEGLQPHRAIYDISLTKTHSGSQVINVDGQMFYEWESGCNGWISNHRFNLLYEYADSPSLRINSDFSTFESFDGREMSYISQRRRDGSLFQKIRGKARLDDRKAGEAVFSSPEDLSFNLPIGTVFPMEHTLNILKAARNGDTFYKTFIFDGSDEEGPAEVNAFIGKRLTISPADIGFDKESEAAMLLRSPARNIRLAFFPLGNKEEAKPEYEMSLVFHENGVISDMIIEYDSFTVRQKLSAIEKLSESCTDAYSRGK